MIADDILAGLKTYIEAQATAHPALGDLTVVLRDNDGDKSYPLLVLLDESTQEHDVLRGVQDPLTVAATVYSVPNSDGASASGTTQATHQTYTEALFAVLGCDSIVTALNMQGGDFKVFDIRGIEGTTDEDDGRSATRFELRVVCCKR